MEVSIDVKLYLLLLKWQGLSNAIEVQVSLTVTKNLAERALSYCLRVNGDEYSESNPFRNWDPCMKLFMSFREFSKEFGFFVLCLCIEGDADLACGSESHFVTLKWFSDNLSNRLWAIHAKL